MNARKTILVTLALAFLVPAASPAVAQKGKPGGGGGTPTPLDSGWVH